MNYKDRIKKFHAQAARMREFLAKVKFKAISDPDDRLEMILCMRVYDGPSHTGRSKIEKCGECGQLVWLDPESRRLAPQATLICEQCLLAREGARRLS